MPAPKPGERWGILGGAFDPVHNGHLALAQNIMFLRRQSGVFLVPTVDPPHRTQLPVASFDHRLAMARLAADELDGIEVSDVEKTTPRPSYTLHTVRALRARYPGVELELTIGADQLSQLKSWYLWETLLSEIKLLVGLRPGAPVGDLSAFPENCIQ
ncbi:MAG: nicotinate (nicotinamide) nucleotide adenylyltransferase, partial [Candidatus Zixiibacteriota bacterium]